MNKNLVVGIDVGGTHARIGLVRFLKKTGPRVMAKRVLQSREVDSPEKFIPAVQLSLHHLLVSSSLSFRDICGVGVGAPGSIDVRSGLVHFFPNLPRWRNVRLVRILSKKLGLPVRVDNDAGAMAAAEFRFGAARGERNAVFLTLGTGIGGGLLIDGGLFHGESFSAAEIGHLPFGGRRLCACGARGCVETFLGNRWLLRSARRDLRRGVKTILHRLVRRSVEQELSLEMITQAARKGDRYAINFWGNAGTVFGRFLAGICNLLNPRVIVIGGGVAKAGRHLFVPLRRSLVANAFPMAGRSVRVVPAQLGQDAGMIGAASMALT